MNYFIKNILFIIVLSSNLHAADFTYKDVFEAIGADDRDRILELVDHPNIDMNVQLEGEKLSALGGSTGREPGMTPLLYALSLERLTIAKIILEKAKNLDLNLVNEFKVSAVHMLAMVEVGDDRYGSDSKENRKKFYHPMHKKDYHSFRPIVEQEKILEIFFLLCERGFNAFSKFRAGSSSQDQDLITESFVHGKPYLAIEIAKRNAPLPTAEKFWAIKTYLSSRSLSDCRERHLVLYEFLSTSKAEKALIDRVFDASRMKEIILDFFENDESKIRELNQLIEEFIGKNKNLKAKDFSSFLEGAGSFLPESTKKILRFE